MTIGCFQVMVGTGDLDVLRLCRHLGSRVGQATNSVVTYGSHLAVHMALGLLFLGGGCLSFSNSPQAVAALICAFFPRFPTHSNDNRLVIIGYSLVSFIFRIFMFNKHFYLQLVGT